MKLQHILLILIGLGLGFVAINKLTKKHYKSDSKTRDQAVLQNAEIPPFKLLSHTGDSITNETFAGKVYVATFFFSQCDDICPMMSRTMTGVQERFAEEENVLFLSHSLDPARDSLQALRDYSKLAKAIPGRWFFARNEEKETFKLAREGFKVVAQKNPEAPGGIDHSQKLVLVDQRGMIQGYYDAGVGDDVKTMENKIRALLDAAGQ